MNMTNHPPRPRAHRSIFFITFLSTGLRLVLSRDVRVQAAPAVGEVTGLTVRGTF